MFKTGCFFGDKGSFVKAIKETHEYNQYAKDYLDYIKEIEEELL